MKIHSGYSFHVKTKSVFGTHDCINGKIRFFVYYKQVTDAAECC